MVTSTVEPQIPVADDTPDPKLVQFNSEEARLDNLRTQITTAVMAGEPFDALAAELATLNIAHRETQLTVNEGAIVAETSQIKVALETLINASQLEHLMGVPITSAIYTSESGTGENGPITSLILNAKVQRRAAGNTTGKKSTTNNTAGNPRKTSTYTHPDGTIYTARDFVLQFAPEDVLNNSLVMKDGVVGKWPTKPTFIDQTLAHQAGLGVAFTITEPEVEPVVAEVVAATA